MDGPRAARLVETVLRCYPARWRRHGDEAAALAALLIRDGTPAGAIAWNYLAGAARAWLTPRPGGACALGRTNRIRHRYPVAAESRVRALAGPAARLDRLDPDVPAHP